MNQGKKSDAAEDSAEEILTEERSEEEETADSTEYVEEEDQSLDEKEPAVEESEDSSGEIKAEESNPDSTEEENNEEASPEETEEKKTEEPKEELFDDQRAIEKLRQEMIDFDIEDLKEWELFKKPIEKIEMKNKIKAILFASGKKLTLKDITRLCRKRDRRPVFYCLRELKEEYNNNSHDPLILVDDNLVFWKLTLKDKYTPVVEKLVTQTELPKTIIETLAVIAWKAPVMQSEVIKIRTNKAYDHVKQLEEEDYIITEKYGRTKMIRLTQKFHDYFDIGEKRLREMLEKKLGVKVDEKTDEQKLEEIEQMINDEESAENSEIEKENPEPKEESLQDYEDTEKDPDNSEEENDTASKMP